MSIQSWIVDCSGAAAQYPHPVLSKRKSIAKRCRRVHLVLLFDSQMYSAAKASRTKGLRVFVHLLRDSLGALFALLGAKNFFRHGQTIEGRGKSGVNGHLNHGF